MRFFVDVDAGERVGTLPVAMTMFLVSSVCLRRRRA